MNTPSDTESQRPLLALTMGDPAGIGLEIALKVWRAHAAASNATGYDLVFFSDPDEVAACARRVGLADPSTIVEQPQDARGRWPRQLPVLPIALARPATPGQPDPANARSVISAIETATAAVLDGAASAIVTNPIAKHVLYEAGFAHPGHTEFLAHLASRATGGKSWLPVMMLACDELRVVPLTIHVPISAVPRAISRTLILDTVRIVAGGLERDFGLQSPARIAVAGLNPHAGENGSIGTEDQTIIAPAIAALQAEGYAVTGPHSADTLFHAAARTGYDAVVAMYHDQALIPIKTLAFDSGVNVTLGLPFVRTSPDHGTAFDIAGSGRANPASLAAALDLAARLAINRSTSTRT